MTTNHTLDRRTVLRATGAAIAVSLAGCTGGGEPDVEYVDDEPDYEGWFDGTDNYDGTVDVTDEDSVQVDVGGGNGLQFEPAAIQISPGTQVVWEWTGEGGDHNVSSEDDLFESETVGDAGFEFDYTFDESGVYLYACTPHRSVGMRGAVVVE